MSLNRYGIAKFVQQNSVRLAKFFVPKFMYRNDYYFEETNKKVFVRQNGDGVIVCSFELFVINPDKINYFIRGIDVSDAKKSTVFPPFEDMYRNKLNKPFEEYGFEVFSENNIIIDAVECYEDEAGNVNIARNNPQCISIKLVVDKNKLKARHTYKVVYAYSIPGLFPLCDGKHDVSEYSKEDYPEYSSCMQIDNMSKRLKFAIYLDNSIRLHKSPVGSAVSRNTNKAAPETICQVGNNLFYTKYLYELKNSQKYHSAKLTWEID